jgi:hypothetical protein
VERERQGAISAGLSRPWEERSRRRGRTAIVVCLLEGAHAQPSVGHGSGERDARGGEGRARCVAGRRLALRVPRTAQAVLQASARVIRSGSEALCAAGGTGSRRAPPATDGAHLRARRCPRALRPRRSSLEADMAAFAVRGAPACASCAAGARSAPRAAAAPQPPRAALGAQLRQVRGCARSWRIVRIGLENRVLRGPDARAGCAAGRAPGAEQRQPCLCLFQLPARLQERRCVSARRCVAAWRSPGAPSPLALRSLRAPSAAHARHGGPAQASWAARAATTSTGAPTEASTAPAASLFAG